MLRSETLDDFADVEVQLEKFDEAERLGREALAADRKRMIAAQADLIRDTKLSADIVKLVTDTIGSAS